MVLHYRFTDFDPLSDQNAHRNQLEGGRVAIPHSCCGGFSWTQALGQNITRIAVCRWRASSALWGTRSRERRTEAMARVDTTLQRAGWEQKPVRFQVFVLILADLHHTCLPLVSSVFLSVDCHRVTCTKNVPGSECGEGQDEHTVL